MQTVCLIDTMIVATVIHRISLCSLTLEAQYPHFGMIVESTFSRKISKTFEKYFFIYLINKLNII